MSVLGRVFDSLQAMTLLQLLLAFLACIAYAVAQGALLAVNGRRWAALAALTAATAFTLLANDWMSATMLVAFAVAGLGVFVALAWLLSLWVRATQSAVMSSEVGAPDAEFDWLASGASLPSARREHAHSA